MPMESEKSVLPIELKWNFLRCLIFVESVFTDSFKNLTES